jgi:sugar O-acyltransferase (sialic acid O-acetyltransferase NeuD family)
MLIIGAKGFAKEVLELCYQNGDNKSIAFYDDVNEDIGDILYNQFPILHSIEQAKIYFETVDNQFTVGIGNPVLREKLTDKFTAIGGVLTSTISKNSNIGSFGVHIHNGCNIMTNVVLTNDIIIEKGVLINQMTSIGHDVKVGEFTEICPNVSISGNCIIGKKVFIGTGAILLPGLIIGNNVVIGAGAMVSINLPDNCVAVGLPAKIIKQN